MSISQFCGSGYIVSFKKDWCIVKIEDDKSFFTGRQHSNLYEIDLIGLSKHNVMCILSRENERWFWHRKLSHDDLKHISKLSKKDLVKWLPKICWKTHFLNEACQQGKQIKISFKSKDIVSTSRPLQLLHMDLFGPMRTLSLGGKKYGFITVDDYSRYTCYTSLHINIGLLRTLKYFLKEFKMKMVFISPLSEVTMGLSLRMLTSNHYVKRMVFSITSLHREHLNKIGVLERESKTMQRMTRTMLCENSLPKHFYRKAMNTTCYVQNKILIRVHW